MTCDGEKGFGRRHRSESGAGPLAGSTMGAWGLGMVARAPGRRVPLAEAAPAASAPELPPPSRRGP